MDARSLGEKVEWFKGEAKGAYQIIDDEDTYQLTLDKPKGVVFGFAYRVNAKQEVFVTGVLPDSPAEVWNRDCEIELTICTGDKFMSVNTKTSPKEMVNELKSAEKVDVSMIKTGPRWHINGITADSMEKVYNAADKGLAFELQEPETLETLPEASDLSFPQFLLIGCMIGIPNLFLVVGFSDMGVGFRIYEELAPKHRYQVGYLIMLGAVFCSLCLYIADFTHWKSKKQQVITGIVVVYAAVAGAFLLSPKYPQVPLVISLFHVPVFIGVLRGSILKGVKRVSFYKGVSGNLLLWAFGILIMWLVWMLTGEQAKNGWKGQHTWTDATKKLLVEDAEPIYKQLKFKVRGVERRTYYDMDCDLRTKTAELCDEDYCRVAIKDYVKLSQSVRDKTGLYCCLSSGICAPDCSSFVGNSTYTTMVQSTISSGTLASYSVYKVADTILCCNPKELLDSDEKLARSDRCAKAKTIWFLVWLTPFAAFGVNMLIAFFCLVNGVYMDTQDVTKLEKTMKQFVLMVCILLLTMWVSSAIAGASMRLTGTLMAFCVAGLVALFIWVYLEIGAKAISIGARGSRLMQSMIGLATSDWIRAIGLICLNMFIPAALFVNMINQSSRRMRGASRNDSMFTDGMNYILKNVQNWNWASILIKVNWLCLLYWLMSVGVAKLTQVFLSWLNSELLKIDFVAVVIVFFIIGFIMFMLPPVPGLPVYMSSGIVIASRARTMEIGFFGGTLVAVALSFTLKITASSGQYMIGYCMGKSVKVQQAVGVDKVFTRAIQSILEKRGMPLSKVSVLVGGPDWPTSVLCGILKLNLISVIWGTCPVIFVSTPVVLAGSFMAGPNANVVAGTDETGLWDTLTPVMIGLAFMSQLASAVVAVYYIQEVIYTDGEQLAKNRREHDDVARLTKAEAQYVQAYNEVLDWKTLKPTTKFPLFFITGGLMISNFFFVFFDETCFRPFKVTGVIDAPYDEGGLDYNWLNIIRPLGWVAHVAFIICAVGHFAGLQRAASATREKMVANKRKLDRAIADGLIASSSDDMRKPEEKRAREVAVQKKRVVT